MYCKKKVICVLSILIVLISLSNAFGDEIGEYKAKYQEIENYFIDIDGDGKKEREIKVDREEEEISIGKNKIFYSGFLYEIIYEDLTDDGISEVIVVTKDGGTSSLLNYGIYEIKEEKIKLIFKREGIYRGIVGIEEGRIIEKMPQYGDRDTNASPREYVAKEYLYYGDEFKLVSEDTKDIKELNVKNNKVESERRHNKYYNNPKRSEMEEIIGEVALEKGIPPVVLKSIAYTESGLKQFKNGQPLESFDGISYGVMQVTPRIHTQYDEKKLKYDIRYNVMAGADILLSKWSYAFRTKPIIPKVGNGDPRVLENWYFAIWAYNGWSESNNPNMIPYEHLSWVQRRAYQDKVIDYALSQFDQRITRIDEDDLPGAGLPEAGRVFHTPRPYHKAEYKTYDYGDIIINMADSGLVLRDDDWNRIETIPPRVGFIIICGPKLHNGYVRYKVRPLMEDREKSLGWVAINWTKTMNDSDVNHDGKTDLKDVSIIIDNIDEDRNLETLDMNYDDEVDDYDALLVEKKYRLSIKDEGYKIISEKREVSASKDWIIEFNEKLDSKSVNNSNIYVEDKSRGTRIKTKVRLQGDGRSIKIYHPEGNYIAGNKYVIKIEDKVKSYSGKTLKEPVLMEFTIKF